MEQDKFALRASQAGMRFMAQTHLYNTAPPERLLAFIADSYHPDQLAQHPAEQRLADFEAQRAHFGRLKVKQVMAANEHHVIIIIETERNDSLYYVEVKVEAEYPHRITFFMNQPLRAITTQ